MQFWCYLLLEQLPSSASMRPTLQQALLNTLCVMQQNPRPCYLLTLVAGWPCTGHFPACFLSTKAENWWCQVVPISAFTRQGESERVKMWKDFQQNVKLQVPFVHLPVHTRLCMQVSGPSLVGDGAAFLLHSVGPGDRTRAIRPGCKCLLRTLDGPRSHFLKSPGVISWRLDSLKLLRPTFRANFISQFSLNVWPKDVVLLLEWVLHCWQRTVRKGCFCDIWIIFHCSLLQHSLGHI